MNAENMSFYDILFNNKKVIHSNLENNNKSLNDTGQSVLILSANELNNEEDRQLLQSIMSACKLENNDWIHLSAENFCYQDFSVFKNLEYIILLGNIEKSLNINVVFSLYHPIEFHNNIWIKAHTIKELKQTPEYKKAFWTRALKPVFVG